MCFGGVDAVYFVSWFDGLCSAVVLLSLWATDCCVFFVGFAGWVVLWGKWLWLQRISCVRLYGLAFVVCLLVLMLRVLIRLLSVYCLIVVVVTMVAVWFNSVGLR